MDAVADAGPDRQDSARPVERGAAWAYTARLARRHYENFAVVSPLLPRALRQHFYNVYAFCRIADDLADETGDPARSTELLLWWQEELSACFAGHTRHPAMVALRETVVRFDLPRQPFLDLIAAFLQDQRVTRYPTYDALLDYCRRSANPVGRLVLCLCGYRDARRQALSDCTCTALQLTNFWQDVVADLDRGRIYIPVEDMDRFGYGEADLAAHRYNDAFVALMRFEADRARQLFTRGLALVPQVSVPVQTDIELFSRGGLAILDRLEKSDYNVFQARPVLTRWAQAGLLSAVLWRRLWKHAW